MSNSSSIYRNSTIPEYTQLTREEVRFLMDTYWENGNCILTAGNGINQDCPLELLEAFFQESLTYGTQITKKLQ